MRAAFSVGQNFSFILFYWSNPLGRRMALSKVLTSFSSGGKPLGRFLLLGVEQHWMSYYMCDVIQGPGLTFC